MSERDIRNRIAGYAHAITDCMKAGYVSDPVGVVMLAAYCTATDRESENEKGRGCIGPHTNAHNSGGLAHPGTHPQAHAYAHGATPHATPTTQPTQPQALDATSRK